MTMRIVRLVLVLTVGATVAILVVVPVVTTINAEPAEPAEPVNTRISARSASSALIVVRRAALSMLAASAAVEALLFPIGALIFSRITFAGLVLNFLAIPLMAVAQIAGMAVVPVATASVIARRANARTAEIASRHGEPRAVISTRAPLFTEPTSVVPRRASARSLSGTPGSR